MITRIILGTVGFIVGVALVTYARYIIQFTGLSATLERRLGPSGTYIALRAFGVMLSIISLMLATGYLGAFFNWIFKIIGF